MLGWGLENMKDLGQDFMLGLVAHAGRPRKLMKIKFTNV